jgi:hypothetical protein
MKKIVSFFGAVLLSLSLSACEPLKQYIPASETTVHALNASMALTDTAAAAYFTRPTCGKTKAKICKDMAIVHKINDAAEKADTALVAAETALNQNALEAAQTAVDAYQNIVAVVAPQPMMSP